MRAELDRLARKMAPRYGAYARRWSINTDAGTVSDPMTGELIVYLSHEFLDLGLEEEL
jgi:hypothetical protein